MWQSNVGYNCQFNYCEKIVIYTLFSELEFLIKGSCSRVEFNEIQQNLDQPGLRTPPECYLEVTAA